MPNVRANPRGRGDDKTEPALIGGLQFDPKNHPCCVCGDPNAPWGFDYPIAPRFYCAKHRATEAA